MNSVNLRDPERFDLLTGQHVLKLGHEGRERRGVEIEIIVAKPMVAMVVTAKRELPVQLLAGLNEVRFTAEGVVAIEFGAGVVWYATEETHDLTYVDPGAKPYLRVKPEGDDEMEHQLLDRLAYRMQVEARRAQLVARAQERYVEGIAALDVLRAANEEARERHEAEDRARDTSGDQPQEFDGAEQASATGQDSTAPE